MAKFSARMSVKKFEGEFFSAFSVFSDIMKDAKPTPNDATLKSLRPESFVGAKGGKFKPNGNMKVKNVKRNFNETFGLDIRLYQTIEADQDASLASLRMDRGEVDKRSGEFSAHGRMKVGKFQDDFESAFGVLIRVLDKNNPATASASIASIRIDGFDGSKKADFKIGGGMKVRNVVKSLLEKIGINVQIIQLQEADDSMTMASLKKVDLCLSEENNSDKEEIKLLDQSSSQQNTEVEKYLKCSVSGMEFVWVPGGKFEMGDTFGDSRRYFGPVHTVELDGYWLGKYPVTQKEWEKVMGNNPSHFKKEDRYPVENVSWDDTQEFIEKLNSKSKWRFHLPSEAQWEYAARSGGKKEKYSGGDSVNQVAWYSGNSEDSTHSVGQKAANGLGLHDMSGNVGEWVQDMFADDAYEQHDSRNPIYESSDSGRVVRGGSWYFDAMSTRCTNRSVKNPDFRFYALGFRLAMMPSKFKTQSLEDFLKDEGVKLD